jgi:hypothetical protein
LERLCVRSMREAGHDITVYSTDPEALLREGLGATQIHPAGDVIADDHSAHRYRQARAFHHFADVFRLELVRQDKGVWVDLDCLMLKAITPKDDYLFGRFNAEWLNNAVLMMPKDSAMLADYYAGITAVPFRMPWSTPQRRLRRNLAILLGEALPDPKARTNIGPRALTYYAKKHGLFGRAEPPPVFYPVQSAEARVLVEADDRAAQALVTEATAVVHTWHGNLRHHHALAQPPPPSSYLGQAWARLGMT